MSDWEVVKRKEISSGNWMNTKELEIAMRMHVSHVALVEKDVHEMMVEIRHLRQEVECIKEELKTIRSKNT